MPIYEYEAIVDPDEEGQRFEFFQKMTDPPFTEHPVTGVPIRRVVARPNVAGKYYDSSSKQMLSDNNLERQGFTKYVKTGDGSYEKTVGKGPDNISAGPPEA